ncbi:uncharacterized protein PRCAT00005156001 [Priceomyces carsonii]|uniref:uncharacterized protein n=1 Tax=Priceomyces carsonii TaxID=28549 RepID=UPI002ED86787|nr:unnamed protein product [Priceomyces carsonii]
MGKLKRSKNNRKSRSNPLGRKNSDNQDHKDEQLRQSKVLPLISKLSSTAANDRSLALSAITVLSEDERMRKLLLKEKLISIVMEQCLNDSNDEIVVESFGLLRNIGIEEGYSSVKHMWRSDIWTAIEHSLLKIKTSFEFLGEHSEEKQDKSKIQLLLDFTENILSLIIVILQEGEEFEDKIVDNIDSSLELVANLINSGSQYKFVTLKLITSALEYIYEFTSDSLKFIQKLEQNGLFQLQKINDISSASNNKLDEVYFQGIKFNILEALGQYEDKEELTSQILISLFDITTTIDIDNLQLKNKSLDNALEPIQNGKEVSHQLSGDDNATINVKNELACLEVSLDIITSIVEFASFNETGEPIQLSDKLLFTLMTKTYPLITELLKKENSVLPLEKELTTLNNLCWMFLTCVSIPVEWYEKSLAAWDIVVQRTQVLEDYQIQALGLNILWAIVKAIGPQVQTKITKDMITLLISKCEQLQDIDSIQFVLSAVGFLGSIAPVIGDIESVSNISRFIVVTIQHFSEVQEPTATEVCIEGLNLLYDIFGDKEFDYDEPVFVQQNYIGKLQEIEPKILKMYRLIDKNKNQQLKLRAEEVWINLPRFIEYKIKE